MRIARHDLKPNGTIIPRALQKFLLRFGGKNIYGEPLYRLVRAEDRIQKAAGAWSIWKKGLTIDERGGLGITQVIQMLREGRSAQEINEFTAGRLKAAPERVERGMKDVPVYPYPGFILEKWKPAETLGTPTSWYAFKFEGEAALGPFPIYGVYELVSGPTPYMPTSAQLEDAIRRELHILEKRTSPEQRLLQHFNEVEAAQKAEACANAAKLDAMRRELDPLMNRLSLGAGKVRQELADRAGLKGHYGN